MDRNIFACYTIDNKRKSLSARRAWIEIFLLLLVPVLVPVALRKESVDRNNFGFGIAGHGKGVALRKESVDRNSLCVPGVRQLQVALRKESVDRNVHVLEGSIRFAGRSPQGERG